MPPITLINDILCKNSVTSWESILTYLDGLFKNPYEGSVISQVRSREISVHDIDNLISKTAWDLWLDFQNYVPSTSQKLVDFWEANSEGKAVLVLDGLSLREMPILIEESIKHGYQVNGEITASELPSETTPFAKSLGFSQRSSLENNRAGHNHKLIGARTECTDLPWLDSAKLIQGEPNWVFWHTWLDDRLHDLNEPGKGLRALMNDVLQQFRSNDFWTFIEKLSTGRKVIITSDHGYVSTGEFMEVNSKEQAQYFKNNYKAQRYSRVDSRENGWIPPVELEIESRHGKYGYILGTHKWRVAGGYPTLTHGGLSLLETMVPFIELSKN